MELAAGAQWREQQTRRHLAWVTAHLLQPHLKPGHTISPAELLGEVKEYVTVEEAVELAYQKQKALRGDG